MDSTLTISQPETIWGSGLTLDERRVMRRLAGESWAACPVSVIDGGSAPRTEGQSYCWRTRGGRVIHHPSAYAKSGRSNMVYHASTYCVVVGRDWLYGYRAALAAR